MHLDLVTQDLTAEVERLSNLGAVYAETHTERGTQWVVMTNPEGNEFCVAQVE